MSNKSKARNGSTIATPTTYEYQFPQPKEKVSCKDFIYNSKEGTICGRTVSSWSKLLIFYIIFYAILAALFAISMQGLLATLDDHEPKWQLDRSIIGTNPGLGYRPLSDETERGSIIQFSTKDPEQGKYWAKLLDDFLKIYKDHKLLPNQGKNQKFCGFNTTIAPNEVCAVDIENFGVCSPSNNYGYMNASPCVFLKLNKIFAWVPEYYDDIADLPPEMPEDLKDHIRNLPPAQRQQIWISCTGQRDYDNELIGDVKYIPNRGFPAYYYPYKNIPGYLSPIIAVQFPRPTTGQLFSVECRAWAKNIFYSGSVRDRQGSVTFQFLID